MWLLPGAWGEQDLYVPAAEVRRKKKEQHQQRHDNGNPACATGTTADTSEMQTPSPEDDGYMPYDPADSSADMADGIEPTCENTERRK